MFKRRFFGFEVGTSTRDFFTKLLQLGEPVKGFQNLKMKLGVRLRIRLVSAITSVEFMMEEGADFLDLVDQLITPRQNLDLTQDFRFEKFTIAVKQMHGDKAPGPDGFNPAFYHKCWPLIGRKFLRPRYNGFAKAFSH